MAQVAHLERQTLCSGLRRKQPAPAWVEFPAQAEALQAAHCQAAAEMSTEAGAQYQPVASLLPLSRAIQSLQRLALLTRGVLGISRQAFLCREGELVARAGHSLWLTSDPPGSEGVLLSAAPCGSSGERTEAPDLDIGVRGGGN